MNSIILMNSTPTKLLNLSRILFKSNFFFNFKSRCDSPTPTLNFILNIPIRKKNCRSNRLWIHTQPQVMQNAIKIKFFQICFQISFFLAIKIQVQIGVFFFKTTTPLPKLHCRKSQFSISWSPNRGSPASSELCHCFARHLFRVLPTKIELWFASFIYLFIYFCFCLIGSVKKKIKGFGRGLWKNLISIRE